jgi:hypothetical protein
MKGVLDPVNARRGFGAADLIARWDDIVGPRYAAFTRPEKLTWPDRREGAGVLTVRVDGGRAVFLQHEREQFIERINGFLGFTAVAEIKIIQRPIIRLARRAAPELRPLPPVEAIALDSKIAGVEDDSLRAALKRLGEGVVGARLARP